MIDKGSDKNKKYIVTEIFKKIFDIQHSSALSNITYTVIEDETVKNNDLWSLWSKTEIHLRGVITNNLSKKFGENWAQYLNENHPHISGIISRASERMKTSKIKKDDDFMKHTYTQDLFDIIFHTWDDIFKNVFKKDKNYWKSRFDVIAPVRACLSHNNYDQLTESQKKQFNGFCNELL